MRMPMNWYLSTNPEERAEMLEVIGVNSIDDLYATLPPKLRVDEIDLPESFSELEIKQFFKQIAHENRIPDVIWRGAGAYAHDIPAIVSQITSKERFVTAYTPYQAELSQGVLQGIFEYQTLMSELTGLPISNASMYDGASAAAEACRMSIGRKKNRVILAGVLDPRLEEVIRSYDAASDIDFEYCPAGSDNLVDLEALGEMTGDDLAAVFMMQINYRGLLEDVTAVSNWAHEQGAVSIVYSNPMSLSILEAPGHLGADICVGDGQPLGIPLSYGGPYVGFLCCTEALKRQLPGRIVGETVDREGRRAFVLTLQTREQHIRRERATSNICTNQALCALTVAVYLTAVGPEGLHRQAMHSHFNAHMLAESLAEVGFERVDEDEFFHEFVTSVPEGMDPLVIEHALDHMGHLSGLPISDTEILWCATELNDFNVIGDLEDALRDIVSDYASYAETYAAVRYAYEDMRSLDRYREFEEFEFLNEEAISDFISGLSDEDYMRFMDLMEEIKAEELIRVAYAENEDALGDNEKLRELYNMIKDADFFRIKEDYEEDYEEVDEANADDEGETV